MTIHLLDCNFVNLQCLLPAIKRGILLDCTTAHKMTDDHKNLAKAISKALRSMRMDDVTLDKFLRKFSINENGCWMWTGAISLGRSRFSWRPFPPSPVRVEVFAYRLAYQHWIGPIPAKLSIDHLCEERLCVNPDHLEAVSLSENTLRYWQPKKRVVVLDN